MIKTVCAAAVVLMAGAASFAVTPVQAQRFGFGWELGIDHAEDARRSLFRRPCLLTDSGLRAAIRDEGYRNVYLNVPMGRQVQARATKGSWVYLLQVDICSGEILSRERLRPA